MKTPTILKKLDLTKLIPRHAERGSTPGTVEFVGKKRDEKIKINVIDYDSETLSEKEIANIKDIENYKNKETVTWINVAGLHDTKIIQSIGDIFNIHSLVLEDIANTTQRPKIDEYDGYIFIILKMVYLNELGEITIEQVSIILLDNFVISFQESERDVLDPLRERIRGSKGKIRKLKGDYLMFAIMDSIIDYYFHMLEDIGEKVESVEEQLSDNPDENVQKTIYRLKRRLVYLKKPIWPTRDIMNSLIRIDNGLITDETKIYLRDVYDHTIQIIETLESMRDIASSMMDLYLSTVSNKMNEIMKVLTIFAAIFIPLTFFAGIYGMNFDYIPELSWRWGYFAFWGVILTLIIAMIIYFKKKRWL